MILADTSVWVDFLRGSERGRAFRQLLSSGEPIACTEPVAMEVLAGARSVQQMEAERQLLASRGWLPFDAVADFEGAADIYRRARMSGITPNSHVDCMIIAVAARHEAPLMTLDTRQAAIAEIFGVIVI